MSTLEFNDMLIAESSILQKFALSLTKNETDAGDLVQETQLKALMNKDKFQIQSNFTGWLLTIMKHLHINEYRKMKNRKDLLTVHPAYSPYETNRQITHNDGERNILVQDLENAINSLTEHFKKPFAMNLEGYKYEEIAEKLRLPLGSVKSRIFYARKKIQKKLALDGYSMTNHGFSYS